MAGGDESAGFIEPGWGHSTITIEPQVPSVENLIEALNTGRLEEFVLSLPRHELSSSDAEVIQQFREAAMTYLFR